MSTPPHIEGYIPYSRFNVKALDRMKLRIWTAQNRIQRIQPGTDAYDRAVAESQKLMQRLAFMQEIHDQYWDDREANGFKRQPYDKEQS